jgi:hypothetical protein
VPPSLVDALTRCGMLPKTCPQREVDPWQDPHWQDPSTSNAGAYVPDLANAQRLYAFMPA